MFSIRTTPLLAFVLTSSTVALANHADHDVWIPKHSGGVKIYAEALFMQPDIKDTEYAMSYQSSSSVETFRSHTVSSEQDWGFSLGLGYQAAGTGNDFRVMYTALDNHASDTSEKVGSAMGTHFAYVPQQFTWFAAADDLGVPSPYAKGAYDLSYRKIDAEMAQTLRVGHDSVDLRFHGGLRYAKINTKFQVEYTPPNVNFFTDLYGVYTTEAEFDGLGPRVGVDGTWHMNKHFSLIANVSAAVLVGDANVSIAHKGMATAPFALFGKAPTDSTSEQARESYDNHVVPVLEARLGLSCEHQFANKSALTLEAGYQVSHYFDVDVKFDPAGTDIAFNGWVISAGLLV